MVTYIQGLLGSAVFQEFDALVVRQDYLGKERFRALSRVAVNLINAVILTSVFIYQVLVWRPSIVHIQTNSGFGFYEKSWIAWLAKMMGRRTLLHVHGGNFREFFTRSAPVMQSVIRKCARLNDRVVAASPQMRDNFLFIGHPADKLALVGNAVTLPAVQKDYRQRALITILFLTRIIPAKGIIELIDAVHTLHGAVEGIRLRIVGAEELETSRVKDHIKALGSPDYIQYIGPVSEEQKHAEYSTADIFAFPTHVEDQSYAVMEAMSYGLPCVASDVGGVPSLIQDGQNGLLVPPRDSDSLGNALSELLYHPQLRKELGGAARKTIQDHFSWTKQADEMKQLYLSLLAD